MHTTSEFDIRVLHDVRHLRACEALQKSVWGIADLEVVPVSQLRAAEHAGGLVAGAFAGGEVVGFVYGFPAHTDGVGDGRGMHSHMLGVAPAFRRRGLGLALKWFQRGWCLERGITWMAWTFDPLQAPNANLNLERLGATGVEYHPDFYGVLGGELAGRLTTDRLVAFWSLRAPRVRALALGERPAPPPAAAIALADREGEPGEPDLDLGASAVRIAAPAPTSTLLTEQSDRAERWREAQGAAFQAYLGRGYRADRFADGTYYLTAPKCLTMTK